jgi:putative redox protein
MTVALYARRKDWSLDEVIVRLRHSRIHAADCGECETKPGGSIVWIGLSCSPER